MTSEREDNAFGRVLVVDDHPDARESMADVLRHAGHDVDTLGTAVEAFRRLGDASYDVVVTDLQMPGLSGLEFIRKLEQRGDGVQIVMVTAYASISAAVEAMRHGAFDFLEKPLDAVALEHLVQRAMQHGRQLDVNKHLDPCLSDLGPTMVGGSAEMEQLRQKIAQIAVTPETVLISGESGTGKELVAQSIHAASDRDSEPLVSLNCPALSAHLMESELFGHERGAFTGADAARTGRFELADHGTIFLDEVTEIDLSLQGKLLRVLQERSFERVGSSTTRSVDVRVLASTNRDLQQAVDANEFRQDLYYRLAVVPIVVPPLRSRRSDIPELVDYFLGLSAARLDRPMCQLDASAHQLLAEYDWPGNVRELQNIVTRASVLNQNAAVTADDLGPWLLATSDSQSAGTQVPVGLSLQEMERKLIAATLDQFDGHRAKTAQALGIGLRTLSGKLKSYGYAPRARSLAKAA
ncbi:MAG: sigma-54 dependent transcriptional regulator [Pirellulales bacterium]|nr:sigma-54 dependent transcriptional regulator [Pirellulales bacterium]